MKRTNVTDTHTFDDIIALLTTSHTSDVDAETLLQMFREYETNNQNEIDSLQARVDALEADAKDKEFWIKQSDVLVDKLVGRNLEIQRAREKLEQYRREVLTQLDTARIVQQSLLPETIDTPHIKLYGKSYQLDEIGGDVYDFIELVPGKRYAVLIADVQGHGISASLIAMQLKLSFTQEMLSGSVSPADVLKRVNTIFYRLYKDTGIFFTALFGYLDVDARTFDYSSAGHNGFYIVENGEVRESAPTASNMLGIVESVELDSIRHPLQPSSKLYFVTDGVLETLVDGTPFEQYIIRSMSLLKDKSIDETVEAILEEVASSPEVKDDVTMVGCNIGELD